MRIWKQTIRTAESPMFGAAKKLGGADLGTSATELQTEGGRGCARVYDRTCSSGGRGCDSQWVGNASRRTLRRKQTARLIQYVVKARAKELMCMCMKAQLEAGVIKVEQVELSSRWFAQWRRDYGLSLRRPNRRYTVPKAVLAETFEIGWLNVFRVRAAIAALKGYDPPLGESGPIAFSSQ